MGPVGFVLSTLVLLLVVAVPFVPRLLWERTPERPLRVVVVDKTVERGDYTEHRGLFWLLRHLRVREPGATRPPDEERDYLGYHPSRGNERRLDDLTKVPAGDADLVYVADTFGVYRGDVSGDTREEAARRLVAGGLTAAEVAALAKAVADEGAFVAEFDTFGSPTPQGGRAALEQLLQVRHTGWSGRHFPRLESREDVPPWVRERWEKGSKQQWEFDGGGYVLVHSGGRVIVLREGKEVRERGLQLQFSRRAQRAHGVAARVTYDGWFDIVAERGEAESVGTYRFELREPGEKLLKQAQVPFEFPAVVELEEDGQRRLYLAGDFAERRTVPERYRVAGMIGWYARLASQQRDTADAVYWRVYAPLMRSLLGDLSAESDD